MTKAAWALVAAAAMFAAMPASAGDGQHRHGGGMFQRLDLNDDGAIGRDEARAMRETRFLRWDRDGDGTVTEAEMIEAAEERLARRMAKMFARMDPNGDGRIERAEFYAAGDSRFERMDADGDGRVTADEMRARWRDRRHGHDDEAGPAD